MSISSLQLCHSAMTLGNWIGLAPFVTSHKYKCVINTTNMLKKKKHLNRLPQLFFQTKHISASYSPGTQKKLQPQTNVDPIIALMVCDSLSVRSPTTNISSPQGEERIKRRRMFGHVKYSCVHLCPNRHINP